MFHSLSPLPTRRDFVRSLAFAGPGAVLLSHVLASEALAQSAKPGAARSAADAMPKADAVPLAPPDAQPSDLKLPPVITRQAGWAVVGLGKLAVEQVLPAFRECQQAKVVALVSGHPDKARQLAKVYQVDAAPGLYDYESFDRIAQNPAIDVVYIALPNSLHAEFTIRALRAGKHVLCEKPMSTSVAEAEQMIAAALAAKRQLGIAYRLHHEPMNLAVMAMCRDQAVGEIRSFTSSNCQDVKAPNIRLSAKLGGGPVGDLGVYSINAARYVLNEEPVEVMAFAQQPAGDPRFREVPETVSYLLRFPSGAHASCDCSFGTGNSSRYRAVGTKGFIEMDPAFPYEGQKLRVSEQSGEDKVRLIEPKIKAVNQFSEQFDHFSRSALTGQPFATPGEIGLADMRIVTALAESHRTGRPVKIG